MASANFEAKRNAEAVVVVWCVHISFPAFGALPAADFYWSTATDIELEDGETYTHQLKDIPRGRHQADRGNDYAEFTVIDTNHALYALIYPYEDIIEKGAVTIRECFEIETDYYNSEIRFKGYIKDFSLADEDRAMKISCVSDMSRVGFPVGNRILTRERCGTSLNVNGTLSPTESICGWQTAQGGNPLYCSKLIDGVDGCESHNNTHRFYAIKGMTGATVTIVNGGDTGWDYGSGPCFSNRVHVLMADGSLLPIDMIAPHMKIAGFDMEYEDRIVQATVLKTEKHRVEEVCEARFSSGSLLEVTKEHLFYIGDHRFKPVSFLGDDAAVGVDKDKKPARSGLLSIESIRRELYVYNFRSSSNNYIVTDKFASFFFFVHNNKQPRDFGDLPVYQ